jgi:hypothetical protein
LPRAFTARRTRRKISIEVHRIPMISSAAATAAAAANAKEKEKKKAAAAAKKKQPETAPTDSSSSKNSGGGVDYYEECIVRILVPGNAQERRTARKRAKDKDHNHNDGNNKKSHAFFGGGHDEHDSDLDDEEEDDMSTMAGMPREYMDHDGHHNIYTRTPDTYEKGWMCKYRFPIKAMSIKGTLRTGVFIHVQLGRSIKQTRQLIFDTIEEADDFQSIVAQELVLEEERAQDKLRVAFKQGNKNAGAGGTTDLPLNVGEHVTVLLEMVSGWDLPAGDFFTSDPYVIISFNGKDIHRTKYIPKT